MTFKNKMYALKKCLATRIYLLLPAKVRRATILTTTYMKLNKIDGSDIKAFQDFNEALGIVSDVNSLKIPCKMYDFLWDNIEIPLRKKSEDEENVLSKEDIHFTAIRMADMNKLIKSTDDKDSIVKDIEKTILYTLNKNSGHIPAIC